mgnify:CR=1 FL=1
MLRKIKLISRSFIDKYFCDCYSAWLIGSYAVGTQTKDSDVDIIVLSRELNNQFIETFEYEDLCIQAIVLPYSRLNELINKDYEFRDGVYLSMLNSAILLKGPESFYEATMKVVNYLYSLGPAPCNDAFYRNLRFQITSRLVDMKSNLDFGESLFIALGAIQILTQLNLGKHKQWLGYQGKHLARLLKTIDNNLYEDIQNGLSDFAASKNPSLITSVISKNLKKHGGELHFYTTGEVYSEVKGDEFIIQLKYFRDLEIPSFYNDILSPILSGLKNSSSTISYYTFKKNETRFSNQSVYIVVTEKKQLITDYCIPFLEQFVANNVSVISRHSIKILFPSEFNPSLNFGYKKSNQFSCHLLSLLSNDCLYHISSEGYDYSKILVQAVYLTIEFGKRAFVDQSIFEAFIEELYNIILPKSFNISNGYHIDEARRQIVKIKDNHKETFEPKSILFEEYFMEILSDWGEKDSSLFHDFLIEMEKFEDVLNSEKVDDELLIPALVQLKGQVNNVNLQASYCMNLLLRAFDCFFIEDKEKSYVIYVVARMLKMDLK